MIGEHAPPEAWRASGPGDELHLMELRVDEALAGGRAPTRTARLAASRGRHAAPPGPGEQHAKRFSIFSGIGGVVFLVGLALQAILTGRWHVAPFASYMVQAVVSIELSFLLNRWLTWRERDTPLWTAFGRFNAQKTVTVALNAALYAGLLRLGMNYLVANVVLTAVFTVVNYAAGDKLVFSPRKARKEELAVAEPHTIPLPAIKLAGPSVSVVIPCRNNEATIGDAVLSLLEQDYAHLDEIIIVGSPDDTTWDGLAGIDDPRLTLIERAAPPGVRDANFKRDVGIRMTGSELVALVDSDIVLPPDWLSTAVTTLEESGVSCVSGGMKSIHDSFWGRYTDNTVIGAKTPRIEASYLVTSENFGSDGHKPPITANALFTRELYDKCAIDPTWSHGSYEDYEWFWRVASAGFSILVSRDLYGWHHHRRGMRALIREYRRSARGCAYFIKAHLDCPFAQRRRRQAVLIPVVAAAGSLAVVVAAWLGRSDVVASLLLACMGLLAAQQIIRLRRLEAVAYPVVGLTLGVVYTVGLVRHLVVAPGLAATSTALDFGQPASPAAAAATATHVIDPPVTASARPEVRHSRRARMPLLAFAALLITALALRFWHLGTSPAWQWDEAIYYRIGTSVQLGVLQEHPTYGSPWVPFLYQPPLYFELLAHWFDVVGASVYHARVLGVAATGLMLAILFRLLRRLHGARTALLTMIPVALDGWLLYIERASYIENVLMVIIVAAMLLYQRALDQPKWHNFIIAGIAIGCAASFKQTGAYVLVAALLCWLIVRRNHSGHLLMLGIAAAVIVVYLVAMIRMYDVPGKEWYLDQNLVQIRRVLGLDQSGGTLTSPSKVLHLLVMQYKYFIPSAVIAVTALVLAARKVLQCYLARNWVPAQDNALLFSWFASGVLVFGVSSLKFPQYFALILIPGYCYLWTELRNWNWPRVLRTAAPLCAAVAGIVSLLLVLSAFDANTLQQVQQYAAGHIPRSTIVVTEESIGDLIQQRWCTVEDSSACQKAASYAITWRTYLQSSFELGDPSFHQLMKGAVPIRSFSGAVGTATVWKLKGP